MVDEGRAYRNEPQPHSPEATDRRITELAGRQGGVIALRQLHEAGLSSSAIARRARRGLLHPIHRAVYAVGHTALPRRGHEWAAVLACGPDAVLSHTTAGAIWALIGPQSEIEVTTPRALRPRSGLVVHRTRRLDPRDRTTIEGLPVTSVHRTLVDLAEVLPEPRLAKAVHEAEVQRRFDLSRLRKAQDRLSGRPGRHRLSRVCADYIPPPISRSDAESLFHEIVVEAGIPPPETNATRGGYELDCFWPHADLNVEVDGAAAHKTTRAFYEDRRRDRALRREGIAVVRVTMRDLTGQRAEFLRDLKEILGCR